MKIAGGPGRKEVSHAESKIRADWHSGSSCYRGRDVGGRGGNRRAIRIWC